MKKFKKLISLSIITAVLFSSTSVVFAADTTMQNESEESALLEEYLSYAFGTAESIENFENEFGITFETKPYDFIDNSDFDFSDEWLEDANAMATSYISDNVSTRSTYVPTSTQQAKANAVAYSIDRAMISANRTSGLDLGKEAQYMFISHYIDRYEYYWSTYEERLLLDGATMSGENGYLADWLTSTDRRQYDVYMSVTGASENLQLIGNIANGAFSIGSPGKTFEKGIDALEKANIVMLAASAIKLDDDRIVVEDMVKNELYPTINNSIRLLKNDNTVKLSNLYDTYMNDEGFLAYHNGPDKEQIVRSALSVVASFVLGGVAGGLAGIAQSALKFEFDVFNTYFKYAAWVSLRYGFSGRYANRTSYYLGL